MPSWLLAYVLFFAAAALRRREMPRPLLWLGRISYSVYLWHVPVLVAAQRLPAHLPSGLLLVLALLVTAVVAQVSYRLVERPGIRLGARLAEGPQRP